MSEQAGEDDKRIEVVAACLLKREQKAPKRKNWDHQIEDTRKQITTLLTVELPDSVSYEQGFGCKISLLLEIYKKILGKYFSRILLTDT